MSKRISSSFKSKEHHDELAKKPVRVRVTSPGPIMERGEVYFPAERNKEGKIIKAADVFDTTEARLPKIKWAVEVVDKSTPLTKKGTKEDEARIAAA
jgi:hypothetical protein